MKNLYPKGSEWNKWDMHIHTPESILYNEFGNDWDSYVKNLFQTAIRENIAAIGITDYYFIDGYKKIKNDYLLNDSKLQQLFEQDEIEKIKQIFVFPNIEFRINKLVIGKEKDMKWNKKVNYHILFSDNLSPDDIEENFISRLQFENEGAGEGASQKLSLTKRNLTELGSRLIEQQPEFKNHSPLQVGLLCASVDDTEIVNLLASQKSKFKGNYLLALPADEDLSLISWLSQGHLSRKVLFQKSHIVFSSNQGTIEFSLGKRHVTVEKFKEEFGYPKPCLWGSDAHNYGELFKPTNHKYTWIKSNPTFEGLKQVVFEPEDRVKIQQNKPEEKTPYLFIDKVRYIDKTQNKTFQPNWIDFNQNLNTIIGGKSSGKSLLLFHLAKAIDKEQVKRKTDLIQGSDYKKLINENPFDFEVIWGSGDRNLLSSEEKSDSQITYIPQLYINHLAEENGEQQLMDLIDSILKQNENYKIFIEQKFLVIQECKSKIYSSIDERLIQFASYKKLLADKNAVGNKEKITTEIKRLTEEIEKLNKESGFNDEQNKKFKKLSNSINSLSRYKEELERVIESLNSYSIFINDQLGTFKANSERKLLDYKTNLLEEFILKKTNSQVLSKLLKDKDDLFQELNKLNIKLQLKSENYKSRLQSLESDIKPFQERVKNQELLVKLNKELKDQSLKLGQIEKFDKEIAGVVEKGKESRKDIFINYEKLFQCYKEINKKLIDIEYSQIDKEIRLESFLVFDHKRFEKFTNLFDNRVRLNSYFLRIFNESNEFIYGEDTHIEAINQIFTELKAGENQLIKLKTSVKIEDLYYNLLDDYFKINYRIIYKGDNMLQMSPGKRGLVLLQLILHISNATHPILIDQPEDNLDNRTIYDELKEYIKNKKRERQIILVTHNANLVVSTDAENIIVANQSGQQVGKDKKEFVFEYVSGALENTFIDEHQEGILFKYGIKEHVCDILEGGKDAFQKREMKYGFK